MPATQLVICGSVAIDRIMNFSGRYRDLIKPDKLHVLSVSPLLDKLENSPGGIGANISSNLARLGEHPILLASVGNDARDYIKSLHLAGVDTSYVHFSDKPTASFNVITDIEGSQVGGFYPGAMADSGQLSFAPWQGKDALMVVSPHDPEGMNRQVGECQELGLRLAYDPGQQVLDTATDLKAGAAAAEIVFVNDYERGTMSDKLGIKAEELASKVQILVTTMGGQGSIIEGSKINSPIMIGIAKAAELVDPTGAGDAYRAGFLYGYLRQWELVKCGQLGAVTASFIVEKHGTQHRFSVQDVSDRFLENFNERIEL